MGCLKLTYYDEGLRLRPVPLNNPVRYIDPDGREPQESDEATTPKLYTSLEKALAALVRISENNGNVEVGCWMVTLDNGETAYIVLPIRGEFSDGRTWANENDRMRFMTYPVGADGETGGLPKVIFTEMVKVNSEILRSGGEVLYDGRWHDITGTIHLHPPGTKRRASDVDIDFHRRYGFEEFFILHDSVLDHYKNGIHWGSRHVSH